MFKSPFQKTCWNGTTPRIFTTFFFFRRFQVLVDDRFEELIIAVESISFETGRINDDYICFSFKFPDHGFHIISDQRRDTPGDHDIKIPFHQRQGGVDQFPEFVLAAKNYMLFNEAGAGGDSSRPALRQHFPRCIIHPVQLGDTAACAAWRIRTTPYTPVAATYAPPRAQVYRGASTISG